MNVTLSGDENDIRIVRVDENRWDLFGGVEADVTPGRPGIYGLVNAIAFIDDATGN